MKSFIELYDAIPGDGATNRNNLSNADSVESQLIQYLEKRIAKYEASRDLYTGSALWGYTQAILDMVSILIHGNQTWSLVKAAFGNVPAYQLTSKLVTDIIGK